MRRLTNGEQRFRIPEILFGALLAVALFALGAIFKSSRQPPANENAKANTNDRGTKITTDRVPDKITDWLLVLFNGLLFGSTVLLWRVTRTAADATREAADAAGLSAKAVTVVERAYVYPIIFGHGALKECIQSALVFYLDDPAKDDIPVPETAEITFKFKNFGKTPAILKNAFVAFGVPPHGALLGVTIPKSVLASLEETGTLNSQMQIGITRNQARHILAYTGHICFEGNVTFDDIWGNEHTTEFYFVWDKEIERMALRGVETETKQKGK